MPTMGAHAYAKCVSQLPPHSGGLYPIAVGLFHRQERVRRMVVQLMQRLEELPDTNFMVS